MASLTTRATATVQNVPGLTPEEMERVCEQTFQRYSLGGLGKRKGKGVAIVWFRNDLRVLDNEALLRAWVSSEEILPVYCVDPRLFGTTHYFGLPKTGGKKGFTLFINWDSNCTPSISMHCVNFSFSKTTEVCLS